MKQILLYCLSLFFITNIFCQNNSKAYYLQKSKSQKTVAWILLGAGSASVLIGIIDASGSSGFDGLGKDGALILLGGAADVISIPFFISASRNKRRSATVTMNTQPVFLPQQYILCLKMQPAISLKINL